MKAKFITFVRGLRNGTPPRFQSYLKSLVLLGFLTIGISQVWGATATVTTGTYKKQTGTSITANGSYILLFTGNYVLCNSNAGTNYVTQYSYGSAPASITIDNTNKQYVWVVQDYSSGSFKLVGPNGEAKGAKSAMSVASSGSTWTMDESYIKTSDGYYIKWVSASGFRCYNTAGNKTALVAVYKLDDTPSGYTIDFECNGATSGCPSQLTNQTKLPDPLPTTQQKTGYSFFKWYTNSGLTAIATAGAAITANTTLYAKWNAKNYEITLDKNEHGTEDGLFYVTYNEAIDSELFEGVTASDGWVLNGYFTASSGGEKVVTTEGILVNNVTGWTTADGKWNKDGDNIKLYAQYEQACTNEITISKSNTTLPSGCSFELDKTEGCGDNDGESVLVTCSPATHYTVTAVNSTSGTPGPISSNQCTISGITDDALISVTFTEDTKYTVTFVDGVHGESVAPKSVYENETFTFPSITDKTAVAPTGDCVADHYHFIGWVEEGTTPTQSPSNVITAGTTSIKITKDITYYAVWAKEEL